MLSQCPIDGNSGGVELELWVRAKTFCFTMLCSAFSSSLSWGLAGWFFRLGITYFSKSKYKMEAFRFFLYPMAGISGD